MTGGYVPKCTQCGRFTTGPKVFIAHPVPGMDIEYRLCVACQTPIAEVGEADAAR